MNDLRYLRRAIEDHTPDIALQEALQEAIPEVMAVTMGHILVAVKEMHETNKVDNFTAIKAMESLLTDANHYWRSVYEDKEIFLDEDGQDITHRIREAQDQEKRNMNYHYEQSKGIIHG